ncbi:LysR substrate-binding domain-containing protein [Achromobacter marplatensis]|uniref:LysR substrate-binding domain-containing protein n=1 Tax=Achromobacter marplatensis TaxID=470868 RepID=UPI0039F66207
MAKTMPNNETARIPITIHAKDATPERSSRIPPTTPPLATAVFQPVVYMDCATSTDSPAKRDKALVEVIEEGFDAVIRTGEPGDSRLMARVLGTYRRVIVGAPDYFQRAGLPQHPEDLAGHACLLYRYPTTGKTDVWPLSTDGQPLALDLSASMVTNSLDPQICFAEQGLGIACVPDIAVRHQIDEGKLITVLDHYNQDRTTFRILWPSSRHLSPKIRVFVDFIVQNLFPL